MPKCQNCGESVSSEDLRVVNEDVVCVECGKPKGVEHEMLDKKRVVAVTLSEVPTQDNSVDYEVAVEGEYAGLEVRFQTTFDKVRTFFTQQRGKGKRAALKAIE